ncbi:hypothetical protein BAE44_0024447 [Dichanthelium oligosanthes]|uniref:Uncharacterized protein n=1 Tax=Dichanthelium oligosanthes TaxID=888268 RepID=A0A1E5UNU3_9POAL|nr:hypothetical protein BAE44_0024447 [Dichanthelium oligosanthes]
MGPRPSPLSPRLRIRPSGAASVHRLFINYLDHSRLHFFASPSPTRGPGSTAGSASPGAGSPTASIASQTTATNGLVLQSHDHFNDDSVMYVSNPATRWWARLPPCSGYGRTFLVFDPAVSLHYEVLWTERDPENPKNKRKKKELRQDAAAAADAEITGEEEYHSWRLTEWPPLRWTWHEFSSRSIQWEERVFVREGEAAGTLSDLLLHEMRYISKRRRRYAAYWQGALYVHCQAEDVSR